MSLKPDSLLQNSLSHTDQTTKTYFGISTPGVGKSSGNRDVSSGIDNMDHLRLTTRYYVTHGHTWWSPHGQKSKKKTKIHQGCWSATENKSPKSPIRCFLALGPPPSSHSHLLLPKRDKISLIPPIDQFALSCFLLVSRLSRKFDFLEKKCQKW